MHITALIITLKILWRANTFRAYGVQKFAGQDDFGLTGNFMTYTNL